MLSRKQDIVFSLAEWSMIVFHWFDELKTSFEKEVELGKTKFFCMQSDNLLKFQNTLDHYS